MSLPFLPLAPDDARRLVAVSDPSGAPLADGPRDARGVRLLLDAAGPHLVLPVVWRRLEAELPAGVKSEPEVAAALDTARGSMELQTAQALLLSHHAARITADLAAAGLRFAVVKGRAFAGLYPEPSDRPFTDVDILVDGTDLPAANGRLAALGFEAATKALLDHSDAYGEYKWTAPGNSSVLVELHGNLVHYPRLRRAVSLAYGDLSIFGGPDTPAGRLMVAVLHAAAGHKFHALRLVVDVLQAARAVGARGAADFAAAVARHGGALEAGIALDLAARLYGDGDAAALAAALPASSARAAASRLLMLRTIVDAPGHGLASRLRRTAVRGLQHLPRADRVPGGPPDDRAASFPVARGDGAG